MRIKKEHLEAHCVGVTNVGIETAVDVNAVADAAAVC
jgi:hypothetical protein